ncbi:MAG: O-antigen ligase family protein [Deltaproteobacteria bacterium]|nr:O-antigen ligase family protein [Deltaproteobacteria bacterium]
MKISGTAFPLPLIVFFILSVFYTFHSIDYAVSRDFLFYLISYIVIFFLVAQITSLKETRWILWAVVILGILTSLYGLYQYIWGFQGLISKIKVAETLPASIYPFTDEIIGRLEAGRIFSTFLLPSHFATFLGVTIPLSTAFVLTNKGWLRYLFGLAMALQVFALYLTKSFSGWLSLILACGFFAFIYLGYIKKVKVRYLISFFAALILVLALIFAGLSLTRPDNPLASIENNPLVLRILNWGTTVAIIRDNPWVGKGLDTFGLIYPSYQKPGVNIVHHSHNTYLQLGVEMGIIGTIVFIWLACWWLWRTLAILNKMKEKGHTVWIGCLMVAGMAFFIHHAFDFEFYMPSATLAGFATLALAIGIQKKDIVYRVTIKKKKKTLYTFLGFTVVIAASLLVLRPFYGQTYFQKARGLLNADRPYFAERPSFVDEAAADLKKAIRLDPRNSQYHHQYGVLLVQRLSRQQEGTAEVQEAIQLSPWRHYYHFDLGMIYLVSGEKEKGLEQIKQASRFYPLHEDYHQWLRAIYLQMGEKDLVSQEEQWIERIQRGEGD